MALPFDTPGRLERRIAQGMADQSGDSSLGALAGSGRHGSLQNTRRMGTAGSHGGVTGAYYFGDDVGGRGDGAHSISLSMSSSSGSYSYDSQQNDENYGPVSKQASRKISPLPKSSILGERSLNNLSQKQGPTLVEAVARSHRNQEEPSHWQDRRMRGSNRGPPSVSSVTSSHASSSDVRVRSPPLTSTPHPSRGGLQSSPTRSMSSSQRSVSSSKAGEGSRHASRPLSAQGSISRTASAGFRSALEDSQRAPSPAETSKGAAEDRPLPQLAPAEASHDSSSGSDGSIGVNQRPPQVAPESQMNELHKPTLTSLTDIEGDSTPRDIQSDQTMSPELVKKSRVASGSVLPQDEQLPLTTPRPNKIDQDYMRSYFLSAVKTSDPVRDAQLRQMTPRPNPLQRFQGGRLPQSASRALAALPSHLRQQQVAIGESSTSYAESSHSDASSTRDLTVPAHLAGRGNSSLPDTGPELNAVGPAARVDAARLQAYLHKINLQLEGENVALRDEQDELRRQYDRALLDNEKLRKQLEANGSRNASPSPTSSAAVQTEAGPANETNNAQAPSIRAQDTSDQSIAADHNDVELQDRIAELEEELEDERAAAKEERDRFDTLIQQARTEAEHALATAEDRFFDERDELVKEIERLRSELDSAPADRSGESENSETARLRGSLHRTQAQLDDHNAQLDDALQQVEYLERQLAERYDLQRAAENQVEDCRVAIAELEAEVAESREQADKHKQEADAARDKAFDLGIAVEEKQSDIIRLEMLLRQAQNSPEVTRLKERVTLLDSQLQAARQSIDASQQSFAASAPGKTPVHRSIAALRKPIDTPKSPAELSSASWLYHDSTLGEKAVLRDIAALRGEVDAAHKATDDIIAQLSAAQMAERIVQLHMELEEMQEAAARQQDVNERFRRRVERMKCGQCKSGVAIEDLNATADATVTTTHDDSTRATATHRTSLQKEKVLADVAQQLHDLKTSWAVDQARLAAERQALADARKEFDKEKAQLEDQNRRRRHVQGTSDEKAREKARHAHEGTLHDLSRARRIIGDFERQFQDDFARFRSLVDGNDITDKERDEIECELEKTRNKLANVENALQEKVSAFEKLEMELFETSQMDAQLPRHIQHLETEVKSFATEVERLRNERNGVLERRQTLFDRQRKAQQDHLSIQEELRNARETVLAHQQQLDEQVGTIEKLHSTLRAQSKMLEEANDDRDRLQEQRRAILTDVGALEADLRRVRDESRQFGEDLAALRRTRAPTHSSGAADTGDLVALRKQHQAELVRMIEQQAAHDADLRVRHQAQCRGLLLQIRYEKAKFMRESDLRADLVHQKKYILGVLGGLEMTEEATVRFLADVERSRAVKAVHGNGDQYARSKARKYASHDVVAAPRQDRARARFRAAGFAVVAICRARLMARNWRTALDVKSALRELHNGAPGTAAKAH